MRIPAPEHLLTAATRWAVLPPEERRQLGRALRGLGWTYGEIRETIPVPKGTLAGWCRDVTLTDDQASAILARTGARRGIPRDTQRKRRAEVEHIRIGARGFALKHLHDPLFVAGTTLYWGEGDKTARLLALANADPAAHRLFINWTRRFHGEHAAFVLSLHLHEGNDESLARRWWASALHLGEPEFTKTYIKPSGTGHRKNILPNGVCRVRLRRGTDAWLRTLTWIDVLRTQLAPDINRGIC